MSNEKLETGLASHLTQELGAGLEMKEPKSTKHYKPLETPTAYPLELNENLHICLWAENGEYKWTIAMWIRGKEGYSLEFIGGRPLDKRVKWKAFKKLIKQGQKLADKKFDAEHI